MRPVNPTSCSCGTVTEERITALMAQLLDRRSIGQGGLTKREIDELVSLDPVLLRSFARTILSAERIFLTQAQRHSSSRTREELGRVCDALLEHVRDSLRLV